jgi:hypothetical protein
MSSSTLAVGPRSVVARSHCGGVFQRGLRAASRVRVVFVHGVGDTVHSDTLIDFGQAFAGWVARWQQARGEQPRYARAVLNFDPTDLARITRFRTQRGTSAA